MIWVIAMTKSVPHTDTVRKREVQVAALSLTCVSGFLSTLLEKKKNTHTPHITFICCNAMSYFPLSIQG